MHCLEHQVDDQVRRTNPCIVTWNASSLSEDLGAYVECEDTWHMVCKPGGSRTAVYTVHRGGGGSVNEPELAISMEAVAVVLVSTYSELIGPIIAALSGC